MDRTEENLHVYIYTEGEGKNVENNVISLITHYITSNVVYTGIMNKELNFIMDNCGVKDKNNKVIQLCDYLQELGWFKDDNMIFLVNVPTKMEKIVTLIS